MIIGPPGSNGKYSAANSSIGNFNPQVQNSATFVLTIKGVSPSTVITGVRFQFGTPDGIVQGYKVPGPAVGAGLPGRVAGCGGLIAWLRRRRRPALKTISGSLRVA